MGKIADLLLDEDAKRRVAADCVELVNAEVAAKKGATGLVIKAGFKSFKAVKHGIVESAVDHLLPSFASIMDRYFDEYSESGASGGFAGWISERADTVAGDFLAITDEVVAKSEVRAIRPIYSGLRNLGKKNVAAAVPAMGRMITKYTDK